MDWVIFNAPDDYEWNTEPIAALEMMATNDPDPLLAARAAKFLSQLDLDKAAAKVLRYQRRQQKKQD